MNDNLPRIEFKIEDEDALKAISIVKDPAIEKSFQLFKAVNMYTTYPKMHDNCKCEIVDGTYYTEPDACEYCQSAKAQWNNKGSFNFKSVDTDKMIITGPVMIPNIDILRIDENTGEYYNCFFSEETIVKASSQYLKNSNHNKANFDHSEEFTNEVYIIESWIVENPDMDKSKALGFKDVTKGTWFATYKVANKELWNQLKSSDFSGFSIEGIFGSYKKTKNDLNKKKIYSIIQSNLSDFDKELLISKIIYTK